MLASLWNLLLQCLANFFSRIYVDFPHPHSESPRLIHRLPKQIIPHRHRPTLVLDLDETLVHTTLKRCTNFDVKVDVIMQDQLCEFFVFKRPHLDTFIKHVGEWYEVIIFTASLQSYADPVIDNVDPYRSVKKRLFRESCVEVQGNFVKDLAVIGRDLSQVVIIDNTPMAYSLNAENALPIETWTYDPDDEELLNLLPFLAGLCLCSDVRSILSLRAGPSGQWSTSTSPISPDDFTASFSRTKH